MSRPAKDIPEALVRQLQHSHATGTRWRVPLRDDQDQAHAAELRRTLRRAGYRLFTERRVRWRLLPDSITYWMEDR